MWRVLHKLFWPLWPTKQALTDNLHASLRRNFCSVMITTNRDGVAILFLNDGVATLSWSSQTKTKLSFALQLCLDRWNWGESETVTLHGCKLWEFLLSILTAFGMDLPCEQKWALSSGPSISKGRVGDRTGAIKVRGPKLYGCARCSFSDLQLQLWLQRLN
jgi:hypothetical protein